MVFRGLYHFYSAVLRGETSDVVSDLTQHQKLLGLVKSTRKRHREINPLTQQVWGTSCLSRRTLGITPTLLKTVI